MKKSKIILAVVLAAVLAITCISVPTFSWFTRPQSLSGEKMVLQNKNAYTAYNGKDVTISTKSSSTGIEDSYTTDCIASADFSVTGAAGTGIGSFNRKYFCTTITNSSGTEQNVSLFARKLSIPTDDTNGTLALGVNGPTRSYHDYSTLAKANTDITITPAGFYEFNDVPIVKNVKIPAEDSSTEAHEGEVKVYWYVINNSSANKLRYTIDDIYLGL